MNAKGTVHKFGDNVDTDVIIPVATLTPHLTRACGSRMEDIDADFVNKVKEGDIMVAELAAVLPVNTRQSQSRLKRNFMCNRINL